MDKVIAIQPPLYEWGYNISKPSSIFQQFQPLMCQNTKGFSRKKLYEELGRHFKRWVNEKRAFQPPNTTFSGISLILLYHSLKSKAFLPELFSFSFLLLLSFSFSFLVSLHPPLLLFLHLLCLLKTERVTTLCYFSFKMLSVYKFYHVKTRGPWATKAIYIYNTSKYWPFPLEKFSQIS